MISQTLTKLYACEVAGSGNLKAWRLLTHPVARTHLGNPFSLLRSRFCRLAFDEIPERFSSSLPPLFASGRFATFLYSAR